MIYIYKHIHPVVGFLKITGPQRAEGPCTTCGLNWTDALPLHRYLCPGHFGYIQLPVPVFNPLLFSEMFSVSILACLDSVDNLFVFTRFTSTFTN